MTALAGGVVQFSRRDDRGARCARFGCSGDGLRLPAEHASKQADASRQYPRFQVSILHVFRRLLQVVTAQLGLLLDKVDAFDCIHALCFEIDPRQSSASNVPFLIALRARHKLSRKHGFGTRMRRFPTAWRLSMCFSKMGRIRFLVPDERKHISKIVAKFDCNGDDFPLC